jgi:hypothetical protein
LALALSLASGQRQGKEAKARRKKLISKIMAEAPIQWKKSRRQGKEAKARRKPTARQGSKGTSKADGKAR